MLDNSSIPQRTCKTCGKEYPLTNEYFRFPKDKNGKSYFQHTCIECARAKERERYATGEGAKHIRDWRHKNPEKAKEAKRRSEKRHPETVKARKQRSHIRCREKNNARSAKWNEENRDHVRIVSHEYYEENRDAIIAHVIQYQRDNPEQFRSVQHRHRMRKINAEGDFTAADVQAQLAAQTDKKGNLHCWWCGKIIKGKYHLDHKKALAKGGTNWSTNIVVSCPKCNCSKKDKTPAEWAGRLL